MRRPVIINPLYSSYNPCNGWINRSSSTVGLFTREETGIASISPEG
jgi:hypothetical protein